MTDSDGRPTQPDGPYAATCDRCGSVARFDPPSSGVVIFSTSGTITTLCANCNADVEKDRQWHETGIWVGTDLPPSLQSARPATPEELRVLFDTPPRETPAAENDDSDTEK